MASPQVMLEDINSMFRWTQQAFFFHDARYTYDKLPLVLQFLSKNLGIRLVPAVDYTEIMEEPSVEAIESDSCKAEKVNQIETDESEINPKLYFCEKCKKQFARKWNVQRHTINCTK
jgi:hypothetical protein